MSDPTPDQLPSVSPCNNPTKRSTIQSAAADAIYIERDSFTYKHGNRESVLFGQSFVRNRRNHVISSRHYCTVS